MGLSSPASITLHAAGWSPPAPEILQQPEQNHLWKLVTALKAREIWQGQVANQSGFFPFTTKKKQAVPI